MVPSTPLLLVTSGDAMQGSKHQMCLDSPCLIQQVGEMDVPKQLTNINQEIERKVPIKNNGLQKVCQNWQLCGFHVRIEVLFSGINRWQT